MKFLRDNFAYILLALIAVVLISVTISLQVAILSTQSARNGQGDRDILSLLRQQLAELLPPIAQPPTTAAQPALPTIPLPTDTPIVAVLLFPVSPTPTTGVIMLVATAPATPLPLFTPQGATATPVIVAAAPAATLTATTTPLPPSATPVSPPPLPTATPPPPTAILVADVDFRLGYVERNRDCTAVTELMKLVLEREFDLRIATVGFPDADSLFAKLAEKAAAERVDLSFCYMDPTNRSYLQQYFGFMIFIGSGYRQVDGQKFIIMSNAAVKSPIERGNPCLYRFFTNLNLNTLDFSREDVATWYQNNTATIASWVQCK